MSNIELHRAAHRAFTDAGPEAAAAFYTEDINYRDAACGLVLDGRPEVIGYLRGWKTSFPDATIEEPQYIDGADWTVCRFQSRGTNDGPYQGKPATGRRQDLPCCEMIRWQDGKAVAGVLYYDTMTMLVQLGHMAG